MCGYEYCKGGKRDSRVLKANEHTEKKAGLNIMSLLIFHHENNNRGKQQNNFFVQTKDFPPRTHRNGNPKSNGRGGQKKCGAPLPLMESFQGNGSRLFCLFRSFRNKISDSIVKKLLFKLIFSLILLPFRITSAGKKWEETFEFSIIWKENDDVVFYVFLLTCSILITSRSENNLCFYYGQTFTVFLLM